MSDPQGTTAGNGRMRIRRDELATREEAAEILGVHPNTIDRLGKPGPGQVLRRYAIRGVRGTFYLKTAVEDCIIPLDNDTTEQDVTAIPSTPDNRNGGVRQESPLSASNGSGEDEPGAYGDVPVPEKSVRDQEYGHGSDLDP
jgi:hypothetical protein